VREEKLLGGLGSGNRYRFDKKTTTDECRSPDVRRFHREGLLKSGTSFSWRWWRAGRKVAFIGTLVYQDKLVLSYRSKLGGEWEDVKEPVSLEWTPCNFGESVLGSSVPAWSTGRGAAGG
jgi:hypothetical protein